MDFSFSGMCSGWWLWLIRRSYGRGKFGEAVTGLDRCCAIAVVDDNWGGDNILF